MKNKVQIKKYSQIFNGVVTGNSGFTIYLKEPEYQRRNFDLKFVVPREIAGSMASWAAALTLATADST
jgi:hypothetical protein